MTTSQKLHGSEQAIRASWSANAEAWAKLVDAGAIASRVRVTNRAVVDAVLALAPRRVLDVGCGEGWLSRALIDHGIDSVGIDAEPALVERARQGAARYEVCRYRELGHFLARQPCFDVAVCNFALLEADLSPVLPPLAAALKPAGALVIQTVHPDVVRGPTGWRVETFDTFGHPMEPMPWYLRDIRDWQDTLVAYGFNDVGIGRTTDPETDGAASLLITAHAPG